MQRPSILFVCTLNRTRSPMAEGLARQLCGDAARIDSCGVTPAEEFDPFMLAALAEVGAGVTERPGKGFEVLDEAPFDVIVALSAEANQTATKLGAAHGVAVRFWETPDPTLAEGSREAILDTYREVREGLARRIRELFHGAIDLKGSIGV